MTTLVNDLEAVKALDITISADALTVILADGRVVSVPLTWYRRLLHGSPHERMNWEWIGDGEGIHWPDLDEDIGVEGMLLGKKSAESSESLARWLEGRPNR